MYVENPFHLYTVDEYIKLIADYISLLRKDLVLERFVSQSPDNLLLAPKWGLKNYEFTNKLNSYLERIRKVWIFTFCFIYALMLFTHFVI